MKVQHHLVSVLLDHFLQCVNDGLVVLVRICPFSVGVATYELCSSVAMHHTINVDHRNNLEHEVGQQVLGLFCIRE